MNSLVEQYRQRVPNDPRTDPELTVLLGRAHDQDGRYSQFPDFVEEYNKLKVEQQIADVPLSAEFRNALSRGYEGLKESTYGMGALGADLVGAEGVRDWALKKYNEATEATMESPGGVNRIEDVNSLETGVRWALGRAGEFIPIIGEAVVTGAAGAAAGSVVAPGPGTVGGGAAGLAEGFFARQAAKSIIKTGVKKLLKNVAPEVIEEVEEDIARIAGGKALKEALHPVVEKMMKDQIPALAKQYGVNTALALNFGTIAAGTSFGRLRQEEGVTPEDARWAALIAGAGGVAEVVVPVALAKKLFPLLSPKVADGLTVRVLKEASAHVPLAGGSEVVAEAANIAAERFARKTEGKLTDEELSRLLNAGVAGGAFGVFSGVAAGIPKVKIFDPAVERHFADVPEARRSELVALKTREKLGTLTETDRVALKTLDAQESAFAGMVESMTQEELDQYTVRSTEADRVEPPAEEPAAEVKAESKPAEATGASVKLMVTSEQHQALADLGYTEQDRNSMRPEEAQSIIDAQLKSPKAVARARAAAATVQKSATVDPAVEAAKARAKKDTNPTTKDESAELEALRAKDLTDDGLTESENNRFIELSTKETRARRASKTAGEAKLLKEAGVEVPDNFLNPSEGVANHITGWTRDRNGFIQIRVETHTDASMSPKLITVKPGDTLSISMDDQVEGSTRVREANPKVSPEDKLIDDDRAGKVASKDYIEQIQKAPPDDVTLETIVAAGGGDVKSGETTIRPGEASVRTLIAELKKSPEKSKEIMDRWQAKANAWVDEAHEALRRMVRGEYGDDTAAFQRDNDAVMRTQTLREPFAEVGGNAEAMGLTPEIGREAWRRYKAIEQKMDDLAKVRAAEKKPETEPAKVEEPKKEEPPKQEEPPADRELKTKPTTKEPPKPEAPTLRESIRVKIDSKQAEIDAIKAQLDAIAKETGEVDWNPSGPESGFILNPLDLIGIKDPKQIPLLVEMAKLAFESGALKFADFALVIIEKLGKGYAQFVASLYEATRNYFKSIADNEKLTQAERDSARDTIGKMTPIDEMGDAVLAMGKRVFEQTEVKVYAADHVIKVTDVDVEGRGTRDKSAIGRENPVEAEKLWNELRDRDRKRLSKLSVRQAGKVPPLPTWKDMLFIHPKTGKIDTFAQRAFIETLPREMRERIRIAEQVIVEPAFFVPKTRNLAKLTEALLSDSSPPSGKFANSYTFRLADVFDNDTGKIHRVSVFENNGKAMLTIFDEAVRPKGQGHKSTDRAVSLKDVLANKRFSIIGSLRTKGLTEYYHETFGNRKIYRDTFTRDVMSRQKAVQESARAEQVKMEAHGIEAGADYRQTLDESIANAEFKENGESEALPSPETAVAEQIPTRSGTLAEDPGAADVSEVSSGGAVGVETKRAAKVLNLDANEVRILREELPGFETLDELSEMLKSVQIVSDDVLSLIEKIAKRDVSFFSSVVENGLETTLKDYGYTDTGKGQRVQQGAVAAAEGDISAARGAGEEGAAGSKAAVAGQQDIAGQPGQKGSGGNAQPDQAGGLKFNIPESGEPSLAFPEKNPSVDWRIGDTVKPAEGVVLNGLFPEITEGTLTGNVKEQSGVTFRQLMFKHPEDGRPVYIYKPQDYLVNQRTGQSGTRSFNNPSLTTAEETGLGPEPAKVARTPEEIRHDELVTNIHQAAVAAGIDVSRVQGQFRFGVYDPDTVSIMQVTAEVVGRQDVKTAFHEVAHDVFRSEMPEVRDSILRAIDSLSDKALGVDMSPDTRIRSDDPAKLGKRAVNEERLVESTAERLTAEGFDPVQARGFAQKFVRALKDFYFKAVMKVQEMFGHEPNGELARRYFENRVRQLLAGDTSRMSYQQWLRIGRPSLADRHDRFFRAREFAERIENGIVTYDHQSDLTMDGARFNNNAMFNLPTEAAGPLTRTIEVEKRVAVLNHLAELQERAASAIESNPELAGKLKGSKKNATQWLRSLLKISDPKDAKDELAKWREVGGDPVKYDENKKIDGFTGKSNTDAVLVRAFRNAQGLRSKVWNAARRAAEGMDELVAKRDAAKEKHVKQAREYKDHKGQATEFKREVMKDVKLLFNSMMGLSKKAGVIEQQIAALDPTKTLKDYTPAFENLIESNALGSQGLFDVLDASVNDPKVDFTKPINEVRDAMLASYLDGGKPYDLLLNDTNQSRALLATVVAFAKTHARTLAELELRREKSGEKRAEIEAELAGLLEQKKDFGKQLTELGKTAKLEERARKTYYDSVREIQRFDKAISTAKSRMDAAESVLPVVDAEVARLTGLLDAALDFTVRDGATYLAAKPGMSSADLMARNKDGELKHVQKLALNSALKTTDPAKVHSEMIEMKRWLDERDRAASGGDDAAHDSVYQSVRRAYLELGAHLHFQVDAEPAHKFMWEMAISGAFKRIKDAYGTPASQIVDRIGNLYERVRSTLSREGVVVGHKTMQFENELLKLIPLTRDTLRENILNPVKSLLQFKTRDLPEMFPGMPERVKRAAYGRVREMLLNNKSTEVTKANVDAVMPALERLIEHQHEANKRQIQTIERGIQVRNPFTGSYEHSGVGVLDPKLKIYNPSTGKMESAVRRFVDSGPWTFSQKLSRNFATMIHALRNSDWASFKDVIGESTPESQNSPAVPGKLAEAYKKSPMEAQKLVDRFFNDKENGDQVKEAFFRAIAEMPEEAGFDAPLMADGVTRPPADPLLVMEAMETSGPGNLVKFAETLFDLHEGAGSKADYVQSVAERLNAYFEQMDAMDRRNNPDVGEGSVRSIRGMTPDAMINSRELEGLPGSWFDYHDFDQRDMFRMSERIASEIAFGRGQERLAGMFDTVGKEADEAISRLNKVREELKRANPGVEGKKLEKLVKGKMGEGYEKLKMFERRRHLIGKSVIQLSDFFRRDYSPDGTLRVMTRGGQLLGNLMVNNPGSAIYQMAQLFDTIFRYGPSASTLATTGVVVKRALHESVASLAQSIGIQIGNGSEFHKRFIELGLNDPAVANKFRDAFDRWHGETSPAFALRSVNEVTQAGFNPLGDKAQHTLLRPAGIFNTSAIIADRALTEGIWNLVGRFVMKGMEYYNENPSRLEDASHVLSESDLNLSGWNGDKHAFSKLKQDMGRWGIDYDSMVKGAIARNDKTLITNEDAMRLHSMAMSELSSQANLVTMTPGAWNNSIIRFMIPLLGWSIRRTGDVASKRLGVDGKMSAQALARGMAALAVISTGGMVLSALVDEYYEELLGKKRNLRPILTPGGLLEHSARLGQTGLFGELANGFMNVGTGGDSRIISLDRRVVAVSAFMTIQSAVSAMINQGEVDYARVVRPIVASMGGNGALQYMQMANNAFGLENAEADITRRMNAQNYLRVAGRELGLDVRKFTGGGYSNVTPMSPHMTRMEMAAYADDPVAFRSAYLAAIKKAQQEEYPDPVDHVKRAFAARNPLRSSFQTSPSESDYNRLLAALPPDGRRDVSNAVESFNRYAESIGARGFEGREEKKAKTFSPAERMNEFMRRSVLSP